MDEQFGHIYYCLSGPCVTAVCVCINTFENFNEHHIIFNSLHGSGSYMLVYQVLSSLPHPGPESQSHGQSFHVANLPHYFQNHLMYLVYIWHDDRYWFKHFLSTITHLVSCKLVRCPWSGHE